MEIEFVIRGVDDAAALRAVADEKFQPALKRYESHVRRITVRLEDETGPTQHRVDKICAIEVKLGTGEVRVREVGKDFLAVIDVAIDRLKAALGRQIGRDKRGVGAG